MQALRLKKKALGFESDESFAAWIKGSAGQSWLREMFF
jgi:hypothetical protein